LVKAPGNPDNPDNPSKPDNPSNPDNSDYSDGRFRPSNPSDPHNPQRQGSNKFLSNILTKKEEQRQAKEAKRNAIKDQFRLERKKKNEQNNKLQRERANKAKQNRHKNPHNSQFSPSEGSEPAAASSYSAEIGGQARDREGENTALDKKYQYGDSHEAASDGDEATRVGLQSQAALTPKEVAKQRAQEWKENKKKRKVALIPKDRDRAGEDSGHRRESGREGSENQEQEEERVQVQQPLIAG